MRAVLICAGTHGGRLPPTETIRHALGVPQLNLLGFSSATRATLITLKRFQSGIGRIVLIRTEASDHARKLPSNVDWQIARIGELRRVDSALSRQVPAFVGTARVVLARAEQRTCEVRIRAPPGDSPLVPVARYALAYIAAKNMSGPGEIDFLLRLFTTLARDNLSVLAATVQRIYARRIRSQL